jgi:hypothetical protein
MSTAPPVLALREPRGPSAVLPLKVSFIMDAQVRSAPESTSVADYVKA